MPPISRHDLDWLAKNIVLKYYGSKGKKKKKVDHFSYGLFIVSAGRKQDIGKLQGLHSKFFASARRQFASRNLSLKLSHACIVFSLPLDIN